MASQAPTTGDADKGNAHPGSSPAGCVWKFGYGSNMGLKFLREKKALSPMDSRRCVLKGYSLSFPEGKGLDLVEPAFATLKQEPAGEVHGVAVLFNTKDVAALNSQEGGYRSEVLPADLYGAGGPALEVEVYLPKTPPALAWPEGCCSARYRAILVEGAKEAGLAPAWIAKLQNLAVYEPSAATLALRDAVPSPSKLPQWSIAELAGYNGQTDGLAIHTSSCGYIFKHTERFKSYHGRDVTFRNVLQARGINLDANDDGGASPFPRLSKLEPAALEYALRYRDRFIKKSEGMPVAVLTEFWQEQEQELPGVFCGNSLSRL